MPAHERTLCARGLRRSVFVVGAVLVSSVARPADASDAEHQAAAELLFRQGKELMDQGQYALACDKLQESNDIDPALGTLLNLAVCYEKGGRQASAWVTFNSAAAQARAQGEADRESFARERAAALEPILAHLTVVVTVQTRDGLTITRGGSVVDPSLWGQGVPVDPGPSIIRAERPGCEPWQTTVRVEPSAAVTVRVPVLRPAATAAPNAPGARTPAAVTTGSPSVAPDTARRGSGSPSLWSDPVVVTLAATGVCGLGVAGFFGWRAYSRNTRSLDFCDEAHPNECDSEGVDLRNEARAAGDVATVAGVIGTAALAGAVVLHLTNRSSADRAALSARIGPGGAWLGVVQPLE
jgi:hypothetical protein